MKRIIVYNKIDLANEKKSVEIMKHIANNQEWLHTSTKENININRLVKRLSEQCPTRFRTVGAWVMIGGMPNIGKSTIINTLRKRDAEINSKSSRKSGAKAGAKPCLTKSISGFRIVTDPPMYLVDTPGIMAPKIREESEDGLKLAACHSIRDGILDDELICDYILFKLNQERVFTYVNRYNIAGKKPIEDTHSLLVQI